MTLACCAFALLLWPVGAAPGVRLGQLQRQDRLSGTVPAPRPAVRPPRRGAVVLVAALTGAVVTLLAGPLLGIAAGLGVGCPLDRVRAGLARRAAGQRARERREAVRALRAELEAGTALEAALVAVAAGLPGCRDALRQAAAAARAGLSPGDALAEDGLAPVGAALRVAAAAGAPAAAVLARVDTDLTATAAQHRAVGVALAGARASGGLLAGLPLLGLALGVAMGARPQAVLLGSTPGRVLMCAGVGLDAAGVWWTAWLAARAESG